MQKGILDRWRLGLWIDNLQRLSDFVFLPHCVAECDREGAMTQNDGRCRRFVGDQKCLRERERKSVVHREGIDHLTMAPRQGPRPIWTIDGCRRGLRGQRLRCEPCESEHHCSRKAEKASARRYIVNTLAIAH